MKAKPSIPLFSLQERSSKGVEIIQFENIQLSEPTKQTAHRDDHYILIFQEKGRNTVMVDFKEVVLQDQAVFVILPGQVHYPISSENTLAWFIALDTSWVQDTFRPVFQGVAGNPQPIAVRKDEAIALQQCMVTLAEVQKQSTATHFYEQTIRALAEACVSLFASLYYTEERQVEQSSLRIYTITRQFRSMLLVSFKMMKSPAEYAAALHISPSYLNEAVKQTTGFPVSYWIHQEIILEAKRMLYYTESTVKEIAFALGYSDYTYFIRLFSKGTGLSPLQFRQQYRK